MVNFPVAGGTSGHLLGGVLAAIPMFAGALAHRPVWLGHSAAIRAKAFAMLSVVNTQALLNQRFGQLSCGQLQRVLLALALTPVPDLLHGRTGIGRGSFGH